MARRSLTGRSSPSSRYAPVAGQPVCHGGHPDRPRRDAQCTDRSVCRRRDQHRGSWGTLSEVALAVRTGVPVVMLRGWDLPEGPVVATTAREAVELAVALAQQ